MSGRISRGNDAAPPDVKSDSQIPIYGKHFEKGQKAAMDLPNGLENQRQWNQLLHLESCGIISGVDYKFMGKSIRKEGYVGYRMSGIEKHEAVLNRV